MSFFTDPYPNELLYSAIARYHYYIGNFNYFDTIKELYGERKPVTNLYFAAFLDNFVKVLGGNYSVEELIYKHTLYPYFQPFLNNQSRVEIIEKIRKGNPNLGYLNKTRLFKKKRLYYCSKCAIEDKKNYGHAYFHCEHQANGMLVCPKHKDILKLYDTGETQDNLYKFARLDINRLDYEDKYEFDDKTYENMCKMSELIYELFTVDSSLLNKQILSKYYKSTLKEKGFTSIAGPIKKKIVKEEMLNYYGLDLLNKLDCTIEIDKECWVDKIYLDNDRYIHPIRHLLMINYLGNSISDVIANIDKEDFKYFGQGPWPCMNMLCNNYKKDVIKDVTFKNYYTQEPLGIFKCKYCGFTYSRLFSYEKDDKYEVRSVIEKGELWYETLRKYAEDDMYTISDISRLLSCSRGTVRYDMKKANIGKYSNYETKIVDEKKLNDSKDILLNVIKSTPNLDIGVIRKTFKNDFNYILKYDEDWLNVNLSYKRSTIKNDGEKLELYKEELFKIKQLKPNITRRELIKDLTYIKYDFIKQQDPAWWMENVPVMQVKKYTRKTFDWGSRDKQLLKILKKKYKEICKRDEVVKISKNLLNGEIDDIIIQDYYLNRMPLSKAYIESIVDTNESFRIKCYKKYIFDKFQNNKDIEVNIIPKNFHGFGNQNQSVIEDLEYYIESLKENKKIS